MGMGLKATTSGRHEGDEDANDDGEIKNESGERERIKETYFIFHILLLRVISCVMLIEQ